MPLIHTATALLSEAASFAIREESDSSCTGGCIGRWKIVFAALLLIEGLVFGHVVYLVKKYADRRPAPQPGKSSRFTIIAHFGNALSAGVFFATGFLHILPETIELLSGEDPHGEEEEEGEEEAVVRDEDDAEHGDEPDDHEVSFPWGYFTVMVSFYAIFLIEKILIPKVVGDTSCTPTEHIAMETSASPEESSGPLAEKKEHIEAMSGAGKELELQYFRSKEFVTSLIQILAISAHSLFESMAMGVSKEFSTVLNIFIATAAHRWLTAMAISFRMVDKLHYLPFVTLLVLFSTMVPLGIGIGAALTSLSATVRGILFGISTATFVYIGVFEGMADEFVVHKKWMTRKFLATLGGAGIITVVTGILVALDVHG